jgi:hypothetical protein
MERGPAAKAVTEPEARRADRGPRQISQVADGRGPRRLTSSARPFDGTTGGMGDIRDLTGMSWLGSSGRATVSPCRRALAEGSRTQIDLPVVLDDGWVPSGYPTTLVWVPRVSIALWNFRSTEGEL